VLCQSEAVPAVRDGRPAKAALFGALLLSWLAWPTARAWGLGGGTGGYQSLTTRLQAASSVRGYFSLDPTFGAGREAAGTAGQRLQLALGGTSSLKVTAFVFGGAWPEQRQPGSAGPMALTGTPLSAGAGGELPLGARQRDRSRDDKAFYYQLGYGSGRVELQARLMDMGARFKLSEEALRQSSGEDAKLLREGAGRRNVDLSAVWKLASGSSLTSRHTSLRNDKPGDEKRGSTTTDTSHTFVFGLGRNSRVQASLNEHAEAWDQALGKADVRRRTSGLEFTSQFGTGNRSSLRMALSTVRSREGDKQKTEGTREIHLSLAPAPRLGLALDRVTKGSAQGGQTTQSVAAVVQLAPESQLSAAVKTLAPEKGGQTRESSLKLNTSLGRGALAGKLTAEQTRVRPPDSGNAKRVRKWQLAGGLGRGLARANLSAALQEERGEGPSGKLARVATLHVDRALGPKVKLTADREEKRSGSNGQPQTDAKSAYALVAELGPRTKLTAGLTSQASSRAEQRSFREVALEHQARAFRVRVRGQGWMEGASSRSAASGVLDLPAGELPAWAKDIMTAHQFPDAHEFLVKPEQPWLDMPLAGVRIWVKTLRGGPDDGLDGTGFAHRRIVAGRYHVAIASEQHPEAQEGDRKGRPLPVRRRLLDVGTPVRRDLVAHATYTEEASTSAPLMRRHDVALGLRGRLSDQEQLEARVSREAGNWEGKSRTRTSVSLMYAVRVNDDHQVMVKSGYAWSDEDSGVHSREYRVNLSYSKPI